MRAVLTLTPARGFVGIAIIAVFRDRRGGARSGAPRVSGATGRSIRPELRFSSRDWFEVESRPFISFFSLSSRANPLDDVRMARFGERAGPRARPAPDAATPGRNVLSRNLAPDPEAPFNIAWPGCRVTTCARTDSTSNIRRAAGAGCDSLLRGSPGPVGLETNQQTERGRSRGRSRPSFLSLRSRSRPGQSASSRTIEWNTSSRDQRHGVAVRDGDDSPS